MDRRYFLGATAGSTFLLALKNGNTAIHQLDTPSGKGADSLAPDALLPENGPPVAPMAAQTESLSAAEKPFPTDPAWRQSIVPALNADFALPRLSDPLPEKLMSLHASFYRSFTWSEPDGNAYRYLQAELLLNQAADLLDRGVRDRGEWNDAAVKRFYLNLELLEFARLDEIHEREIEAGIYTSVAKTSQAELDATKAAATHNQNAIGNLQSQLSTFYSSSAIDLAVKVARNQAFASVVPNYKWEIPENKGFDHVQLPLWDGTAANKEDYLVKAADFQTQHNMQSARNSITAQSESIAAAADADRLRDPGLKAKADWDTSDAGFRYERTKVSRDLQIAKVKAATDPGGVLNYGERMKPVNERAVLDFRESLAKLAAAAKGLRLLYGYTEELPEPKGITFFDDLLLWVRRAISWLVRFRQLEQSYVLPVSVRPLTKDWNQACQTGNFTFDISESFLPNMRHVRLRGLSVLTIVDKADDHPASLFQAVVTAPRTSYCTYLSPNDGKPDDVGPDKHGDLEQKFVPPCRLGRVTSRGNIREPDVVGSSALYNASPIGSWQLSMSTISSTGMKLQSLNDIQLDLHLAFRASQKV